MQYFIYRPVFRRGWHFGTVPGASLCTAVIASPQRTTDRSINLTNFHCIRGWIIVTLNSVKRSRKCWRKLKSSAHCEIVHLKCRRYRHMVPTVRGSQGKLQGSGKVEECKSTRVQKLTNMQKKFWAVICGLRTTIEIFFCLLRSQIICTSAFKFVSLPLFLVWL